jgi:hypothetical protein
LVPTICKWSALWVGVIVGAGEPLSAYENARGTGNIHIWFATEPEIGGALV